MLDQQKRFAQLRVSVRVLMFLVLALGGWLGWRTNMARRQREAVATVEGFGGWVHYEDNYRREGPSAPAWLRRLLGDEYFREVRHVILFSDMATLGSVKPRAREFDGPVSEVLRELRGLPGLQDVHLGAAREPTDADIAHLSGMRSLRDLAVDKSRLSDEGLRHLSLLPNLEHLTLTGHRFSDEGLAHLGRSTRLKTLWLESDESGITDAGLASLEALERLEVLDLSGSMVSDEGLEHLKVMPNLKEVRLRRTRVTQEGLESFRAARPGLKATR